MMADDRRALAYDPLWPVKSYLGITWNDSATDDRILGFIRSSMTYLDGKLGDEADYLTPGTPRDLLFERVRSMRDSALDVFENNYLSLILTMQNEKKVTDHVAQAE